MGKTKRSKALKMVTKTSLEHDIVNSQIAKPKNRYKIRLRQDEDEQYVDSSLSRKILSAARKQQREVAPEEGKQKRAKMPKLEDSDVEEEDTLEPDNFFENIVINEADERAIELFMSANPAPRRTLADVIMEKITDKKTELETRFSDAGSVIMRDVDPKVQQLYEGVRDVLQKYRSGKLPKAFKMVPGLANWQQILHVTDPPTWSAAAVYQATRIFISNLNEEKAQYFLSLVLLPRIRDDLAEYKRLNFHLYQALRKALFKPGGFMKGIVIPLLESGNCSLREAIIVGSVIARNSIPMLHSATTILKIVEMDYTGANSIFLRIFLDKKYALPFRVVDAVVLHFLRFEWDSREMPVLWHQAFLTFVQRYKADISSEQREALLELLKKQSHHSISRDIKRELENAKCRDAETAEPQMDFE